MGIFRGNGMLVIQLQRADECLLQLIQKVKRTTQKSHMTANGFPAGKAGDSLIDYCLKDGGRKVFLGGTVVNQRLDICLCENTAASSNGIESMIISGVFI